MNKQRSLGSLADLAKILEEASNPESSLRENRKENKPKPLLVRKSTGTKRVRVVDTKRKFWYEKRLKDRLEQHKEKTSTISIGCSETANISQSLTRVAVTKATGNILESLINIKDVKPKSNNKVEAWRRKPGDPVF